MSSPNQNQIVFFDTTLRDDEQSPGCTMHHEEKLREAHQIAVLGDQGDQHDRPDDEEQPASDKTRAERGLVVSLYLSANTNGDGAGASRVRTLRKPLSVSQWHNSPKV
jgi:hypothetical protein